MATNYFCYFALILFTLLLVSPPTASRMLKSSSEAPATTNVVETNTKAPTNEASHGEEKNFLGFGGLGGFGGVGGGAGVIGPHGGFGFGSGIGGGSGVGGFTGVGPLGGAAGIGGAGGAGGVGGAGGAAGIP